MREIRKLPGGERIPVVMMTGLDDLASIHRAYEMGVTDFARLLARDSATAV